MDRLRGEAIFSALSTCPDRAPDAAQMQVCRAAPQVSPTAVFVACQGCAASTSIVRQVRIRYAARTDVGMVRTHNEDYFALDRGREVVRRRGWHGRPRVGRRREQDVRRHDGRVLSAHPATMTPPGPIATTLRCRTRRTESSPPSVSPTRAFHEAGQATPEPSRHGDHSGRVPHQRRQGLRRPRRRLALLPASQRSASRRSPPRPPRCSRTTRTRDPTSPREEIRDFPHKNVITRALGMRETVEVDLCEIKLDDGDRFMLCSDGLSGMLDESDLLRLILESRIDPGERRQRSDQRGQRSGRHRQHHCDARRVCVLRSAAASGRRTTNGSRSLAGGDPPGGSDLLFRQGLRRHPR